MYQEPGQTLRWANVLEKLSPIQKTLPLGYHVGCKGPDLGREEEKAIYRPELELKFYSPLVDFC